MGETDERLKTLRSRLEWRVGGDWQPVDAHGEDALEWTDRQGRRLRLIPGWDDEEDEGLCYGTVKLVSEAVPGIFRRRVVDTWGMPAEAVRRGRERLDDRLGAVAERYDRDPPELKRGTVSEEASVEDALEAEAAERAMTESNEADDVDVEQKELL